MDPLSIAAGIAGLATFGTHLVTEVYQFFDGIADASADVKQTAKDLDSVAAILRQLKAAQDVSASCHVTFPPDMRRDLKEVIKGCKAIFVRLENLMVKYEDVETSLRKRVKWNRVGESEAKRLGGMLAAQKLTLNLTLQLVNNLMTSTIAEGVKSTQSDTRHIIAEMQNLRRELISKPTIPTDPNFTLSRYLNSASTYAGSTLGSDDEDDLEGSSVIGTRYTHSVSAETAIYEPENQHYSGSLDDKFDSENPDQSTPVARPVKDAALPEFHWVPLVSKEREERPEGQQMHLSKPPTDALRTPQLSTSNRDEDNGFDSSSSCDWKTDADIEDNDQFTAPSSNNSVQPRSKNRVKREINPVVKPRPTEPARVERITNEYEQRRQAEEKASRLRQNSKGKEKASSFVSGRGVIPPVGKASSRAEHAPRNSTDKDHDINYIPPPPRRRPPARTPEEDAESRRKTHEAWNKLRHESRPQEKKQPSPSLLSPKPPPSQDHGEVRQKTFTRQNRKREEKNGSQAKQGHTYRFPGVQPIIYDDIDAEARRRTYEVWQKMRGASAPKQQTSSSLAVDVASDSPSMPNSRLKNIDRSHLQPSVQDTPDSSDENTPVRGDIDQISILIEVVDGTQHAPPKLEHRPVQAEANDTRKEDTTWRQSTPGPISAASRAEASPVVDREFNTGLPQRKVDAATAHLDPSIPAIAKPVTSIDYTNAPKIDPFIPTHAQNVFNDFFKTRAWKEPVEEEKIRDWEWDSEGRRLTEVESGPYQGWHGFPGSEPPQPANTPPTNDTPQTMTSKGIQFTDPLELFDNFMSEQMDITDADDPEYWEPSTVRRPVIRQAVPLANRHPLEEWAHVPCDSEKTRTESAVAVKDWSRNDEPMDEVWQFGKTGTSSRTHQMSHERRREER